LSEWARRYRGQARKAIISAEFFFEEFFSYREIENHMSLRGGRIRFGKAHDVEKSLSFSSIEERRNFCINRDDYGTTNELELVSKKLSITDLSLAYS